MQPLIAVRQRLPGKEYLTRGTSLQRLTIERLPECPAGSDGPLQ